MLLHSLLLITLLLSAACGTATYFGLTESAFILASTPTKSACAKPACVELNAFESTGYAMARRGDLPWVEFVTQFYALRDRLVPDGRETYAAHEMRTYQATLAEQLDAHVITEAQWAQLLQKRSGELRARYAPPQVSSGASQPIGL